MGFCPHCHAYYSGNPTVCPECKDSLSQSEEKAYRVPATFNYGSQAKEFFWNIDNAENFGDYILKFSTILLVVNLLATFVCAIVFGKDRWGDFNFGYFVLILLSGAVYSGTFFLLSHGFGYLVKSSISTAEDSAKTLHYVQEMEKAQRMSAEGKDGKGA